jgi:hypothetical protein
MFVLEKNKWLGILNTIQARCMEKEQFEMIPRVKLIINKLNQKKDGKKQNLLPSTNSNVSGTGKRKDQKDHRELPPSGSFDS